MALAYLSLLPITSSGHAHRHRSLCSMPWNRVGRVGKLRVGFRYGVCRPGEWLWVDSNGKMETRHPVERLFGNELPSICNHCGVMADCRKTWKKFAIFLRFSEKWPLRKNYRNSVRTEFITTPINVLCSNFVKFGRREMGKIVRCLHLTKKKQKFAWLSSSRFCADRAQNLSGPTGTMYSEYSKFHPNRFTFGGVSRTREHRRNAP